MFLNTLQIHSRILASFGNFCRDLSYSRLTMRTIFIIIQTNFKRSWCYYKHETFVLRCKNQECSNQACFHSIYQTFGAKVLQIRKYTSSLNVWSFLHFYSNSKLQFKFYKSNPKFYKFLKFPKLMLRYPGVSNILSSSEAFLLELHFHLHRHAVHRPSSHETSRRKV